MSASLPALDRFAVLRVGIPVFVLAFASSFSCHLDIVTADKKANAAEPRSVQPLALFWGLLVALLLAGWHAAEGIALAAIATFVVDTVTR